MDDDQRKTANFLILCGKQIEDVYLTHLAAVCEEHGFGLSFVHSVQEFQTRCLQSSPAAAFVDLSVMLKGKADELNPLFGYSVRWPVLRSKIGPDGKPMARRPWRTAPVTDAPRRRSRSSTNRPGANATPCKTSAWTTGRNKGRGASDRSG